MIKFLRIFSFIVAFPAMLLFFYVIIMALDTTGVSGNARILTVIVAFGFLFLPVSFNRLAWVLEKTKDKKT